MTNHDYLETHPMTKLRCILIGHKWREAHIGPRTIAAIQCARCHTVRFGAPFRR